MYPAEKPILIVDRETRRRQQIERLLAEEGFAVIAAAEGFSAIRLASSRRFSLVIAAVQLPGTLDGLATVRQMRSQQPELKALFIGDAKSRPAALDRATDEFISSPGLRRELLGCVFELLERGRLPDCADDGNLAG